MITSRKYKYNSKEKIINEKIYKKDSLNIEYKYEYDTKGNKISKKEYKNNVIDSKYEWRYVYDKKGNKMVKKYCYKNNKLQCDHEYDTQENEIRKKTYKEGNVRQKYEWKIKYYNL